MTATSWEIVDDQIIEDERGSVAIVWAPEYVRLIAAAPDMLGALRLLVADREADGYGSREPALTAKRVIAKATGGA